jgi:hypothetical protein
MRNKIFAIVACIILIISAVSCENAVTLQGFLKVVENGKMPVEYIAMAKSGTPTQIAYEISLKNITADTIISFDYTMISFNDGVFSAYEDKTFGGNNIVDPGEQFSILCRVKEDAEQFVFLLKSVSWKEQSSGALFKWDNTGYEKSLSDFRLKGR